MGITRPHKLVAVALMGTLLIGACAESEPERVAPAPVIAAPSTPAGLALQSLTDDNASALVMTLTPESKYGCRTLTAQLSRKDKADGYWEPYKSMNAVYDIANPGSRTPISEQILYASLDKPGLYGITSVTCEPVKGETLIWRVPLGGTEITYGKLNYIGNFVQHKISRAVFVYDVEDASESLKPRIEAKEPGLIPYFETRLIEPNHLLNHDGTFVTVADIVANKNRSGDFYSLYGMIKQKAEYIRRRAVEMDRTVAFKQWKSTGDALQQTSYYNYLADSFRETLYKFENMSVRGQDFDALYDYFMLRIRYDRAFSFLNSCAMKTYADDRNDPCFAARNTYNLTGAEMVTFVRQGRIDVRDSKEETDIKGKRAKLADTLSDHSQKYYDHIFGLPNFPTQMDFDETSELVEGLMKHWSALTRFDAERAAKRYSLAEADKVYYLDVVEEQIEARKAFERLKAQRIGNSKFDRMDEYRALRDMLQRLEDFQSSLEGELF